MSTELLIRQCAPTLAGIKTGSVYSCPYERRENLLEDLRKLNRSLSPRGLCIIPLRFHSDRALLYMFRPTELKKDLQCPRAQKILSEAGYGDIQPTQCLRCLIKRLREQGDFPHEIGLFLSYPPEDVQGFIENRARNYKRVGVWKVYGDEEKAQRIFDKYKKCTQIYCRSYRAGMELKKLAVSKGTKQ
ncbi:MAG: DUF3793 family protein [Oscillospiraceae bacterium]|nr:DUF3793 family protein [Oscillospiraceae bacterium]